MSALDVLSVEDAKAYLNERTTAHDDELARFIGAAVARVEKHLGRSLVDAAEVTPLEQLAVEMVLADYWRTQRTSASTRGGYVSPPYEGDDGPGGVASLRVRLTDLLGEPAAEKAGAGSAPQGSFPAPAAWPDPADRRWC